ncbi:unnamed protein product [Phytomonas sp. EM1]|nr:unnamed protein product [Phytomonas sp. EM1]|eukprot:CCW65576.1 unnamed protein product [Phytomonas sp. isolate EM1]
MFSALKGRLQQKEVAGVANPKSGLSSSSVKQIDGGSLLPSKGANTQDNSKFEDPYTLSVNTALNNRKRGRESTTACEDSVDTLSPKLAVSAPKGTKDADRASSPVQAHESVQTDGSDQLQKQPRSDLPEKDSTLRLATPLPSLCLFSEEEIVSQRNIALHALAMCMRTTSYFWSSSKSSDHNGTVPTPPNLWRLPTCVESYLYKVFPGGDLNASLKGKDDASLDAGEFQLLESVCEELGTKQESVSLVSHSRIPTTESIEVAIVTEGKPRGQNAEYFYQLAHLIHTIWYLIAAQWRHAVLGGASSDAELSRESSPSVGWCYLVYLHEHHMLPDAIKFTKGYEVALQLEAWRGAQRVRRSALELLALLLKDYRSMSYEGKALCDHNTATLTAPSELKKSSQINASSASSSPHDFPKDGYLVPAEIRQGLEDMIVKNIQNKRNFTAARQVYTDMTLGTANWKVGLFSAGEVHMRRSIERVERNRIIHLLNNERAMQMLHSMRELMNVAEKTLTPSERADFFI